MLFVYERLAAALYMTASCSAAAVIMQ